MKQSLKTFFSTLIVSLLAGLGLSSVVKAEPNFDSGITSATEAGLSSDTTKLEPTQLLTTAINYMMFAVAAISVIMIIIGGIRYATSGGSADKVKAAKNTILYACIGLAIALLALAIVSFVKSKVTG